MERDDLAAARRPPYLRNARPLPPAARPLRRGVARRPAQSGGGADRRGARSRARRPMAKPARVADVPGVARGSAATARRLATEQNEQPSEQLGASTVTSEQGSHFRSHNGSSFGAPFLKLKVWRRRPEVHCDHGRTRGIGASSGADRRADRGGCGLQARSRPGAGHSSVHLRRARPRGPAAPLRRGVHQPPVRRREDPRRAAAGRADDRRRAPARRRRGHRPGLEGDQGRVRRGGRPARRRRHEADPDPVPEPRARRGRELPEADRRDGRGRPRDPDQARRPPPQPAHDRVPRQAEAGAEGARGARGLRAARAPARHPRAQVGARGPLVRDAPPAQVRRDQGDGRRAPRRPRGARPRGRAWSSRKSSRRRTSPRRSRAARSTSTPSTTRW